MTDRRSRSDLVAEDIFRKLCSEAGAIRNRAEDDQAGWDYFVEFATPAADVPADLRPAPQRCKVQVKSSIGRRPSFSIKLSNALRFAQEELPCFVVHFAFATSACRSWTVYVRHFWTPMMAQALREARTRSLSGLPLHSKRLSVTLRPGEAVADDGVIPALLNHIAEVGGAYSRQKSDLSAGLGYEEGWGTGSFLLSRDDGFQQLVDLHLGVIDEVPVENFTVIDRRFGMAAPAVVHGSAKLLVDPDPKPCVVTLRRLSGYEELSWPGKLFLAPLPFLPIEEQRFRVVAGPLSLMVHMAGSAKFTWDMPVGQKLESSELARQLAFRAWADSETLEISILHDGRSVTIGSLNFERSVDNSGRWAGLKRAFSALMSIVPPERLPVDFSLSLHDLLQNAEGLERFADQISVPGNVRTSLDQEIKQNLGGVKTLIIPAGIEIGGYRFITVTERTVSVIESDDNWITATTTSVRPVRGVVLTSLATDYFEVMGREVEWAENRSRELGGRYLSWRPEGVSPDGAWIGTVAISNLDASRE